jgi:hypothetical protein
MPKYRATVQVSGLTGDSPRAVRSALDEQLRKSGLENCRVVALDVDAPFPTAAPPRSATPPPPRGRQIDAGGLLLVGAAAWAIWFFWMMLSSLPD